MLENDVIFAPRFRLESTYLADYFGLWMIHDAAILRAVERVQGIDLREHVVQQAKSEPNAERRLYNVSSDGIATFQINGPMMKFVPSMGEGTSTVMVRRQLSQARRDPDVRGVMLVMDTPGGTSKGNEDLAAEVAALAKAKPVYAFVEDMTASAGVSVASQATKRFANNATAMYGSMGTYAVIQDLSGMAEKLGVKVHVVRAGQFKGAGTPGTAVTEEQLAELQRVVNRVNDGYLSQIATGLRRSVDSILPLADGRIIMAADAVTQGLIDGVQSYEATYEQLARSVSKPAAKSVFKSTGGLKMSAPIPATLAELKATFPNSSAEWRETQIEAEATLSDAAISYAKHIEAVAAAEREEHKKQLEAAKNAKPPAFPSLGHPPLTAGNVAGDEFEQNGGVDPVADFDAAVRARLPKNREPSLQERQAAVAYVARTKPALHRSYLEATNRGNKRVTRLIAEKYDVTT